MTKENPHPVHRYRKADNAQGYDEQHFADIGDVPAKEGWLDTPASLIDPAHPDYAAPKAEKKAK